MRTTAVRDGTDWVINGSKQFITHGRYGDLMVVMAVTNRAKSTRGISAFIVKQGTPGFRAGKKENKLGMRASEARSSSRAAACRRRTCSAQKDRGSSTRFKC